MCLSVCEGKMCLRAYICVIVCGGCERVCVCECVCMVCVVSMCWRPCQCVCVSKCVMCV